MEKKCDIFFFYGKKESGDCRKLIKFSTCSRLSMNKSKEKAQMKWSGRHIGLKYLLE